MVQEENNIETTQVIEHIEKSTESPIMDRIIIQLKEVYDPEMPVVDIYTLGLIYDVQLDEEEKKVHIVMTFTTPACPMADLLEEMVKNAIIEAVPDFQVSLEITFDPLWNLDKIKDQDVRRMFE